MIKSGWKKTKTKTVYRVLMLQGYSVYILKLFNIFKTFKVTLQRERPLKGIYMEQLI